MKICNMSYKVALVWICTLVYWSGAKEAVIVNSTKLYGIPKQAKGNKKLPCCCEVPLLLSVENRTFLWAPTLWDSTGREGSFLQPSPVHVSEIDGGSSSDLFAMFRCATMERFGLKVWDCVEAEKALTEESERVSKRKCEARVVVGGINRAWNTERTMALESSLDLSEEFRRGRGRVARKREVSVVFHGVSHF